MLTSELTVNTLIIRTLRYDHVDGNGNVKKAIG